MKVSVIAFTEKGCKLAKKIALLLAAAGDSCAVYAPERLALSMGVSGCGSLERWTRARFADSEALVFVAAAGIAVRAIAPHIGDKFADPAVVAADEAGRFVVSLLSGHMGGANELAERLASLLSATPVVTTATDVNGVFSVDTWARSNGLHICDRTEAKEVSAALLEGKSGGFMSDLPFEGEPPAALLVGKDSELGISVSLDEGKRPFGRTLRLIPRILTVGLGCRRGARWTEIEAAVAKALSENSLSVHAVRALASIDAKEDEEGLLEYAGRAGLPVTFYSKGELASLRGDFTASAFVAETVGVDNVCERAAAMSGGRMVMKKTAFDGVTVAAAADRLTLRF